MAWSAHWAIVTFLTLASVSVAAEADAGEASTPVRVAILDSGLEMGHPLVDGTVVAWRDWVGNAATPVDSNGHGTAIASMVAGPLPAALGPADVELIVGRVLGPNGAYWSDLAASIDWAVAEGADIISISIYNYRVADAWVAGAGVYPPSQLVLDALERAAQADVLPVVLAGNGHGNAYGYPSTSLATTPGASRHALVVGGAGLLFDDWPHAPLIHSDPEVTADYCAAVAALGGGTREWCGTSFSTPIVAGFAASMLQYHAAAGCPVPVMAQEGYVKAYARDTPMPPNLEGYGYIGTDTLGSRDPCDGIDFMNDDAANWVYVDGVGGAVRGQW